MEQYFSYISWQLLLLLEEKLYKFASSSPHNLRIELTTYRWYALIEVHPTTKQLIDHNRATMVWLLLWEHVLCYLVLCNNLIDCFINQTNTITTKAFLFFVNRYYWHIFSILHWSDLKKNKDCGWFVTIWSGYWLISKSIFFCSAEI